MDIQPQQQPISDDQELAKVLAGINKENDIAEAPVVATPPTPPATDATTATETPEAENTASPDGLSGFSMPDPIAGTPAADDSNDLKTIKQEALVELRPLVDKLNVSPEEKFDTYLLLLRSTDDKTLIAPAHEAAKAIADEARRAQALLDVIKEIDFLTAPQQ